MLRVVYENSYGIRDHNDPSSGPLAPVAANPKEDYLPYSSMYRDHCRFIELRMFEATGIDMETFFARPRWVNELDFESVKQMRLSQKTQENSDHTELERELGRQLRGEN